MYKEMYEASLNLKRGEVLGKISSRGVWIFSGVLVTHYFKIKVQNGTKFK